MEVLPAPAPAVATDVEANNAPLLEPSADRSEAQLLEQSTHQHCSNKWLSKLAICAVTLIARLLAILKPSADRSNPRLWLFNNPKPPLLFCAITFIAQLWSLIAAARAKGAFESILTSQAFKAQVTRSSSLEGPCTALFLDTPVSPLPQPTPHQRWWGLVTVARGDSGELLPDLEESVDQMLSARSWIWFALSCALSLSLIYLASYTKWWLFLERADTVFVTAHQSEAYKFLSAAGLYTVVSSTVLCSMYGVYFDSELGLPVVNYVPGGALAKLFNGFWWMVLLLLMKTCGTAKLAESDEEMCLSWCFFKITGGSFECLGNVFLMLALLIFLYLVFWILIPMPGYVYWFAWDFVDAVVQQEVAGGGAVDTGIVLPTGETLIIHDAAAEGLEAPFAFAIWTGLATFIIGVAGSIWHGRPIKARYTCTQFKEMGYSCKEAEAAGYTLADMKDAGFGARAIEAMSYSSCKEAKEAGYTCKEVKEAGFLWYQVKAVGYTREEGREAGYAAW